MIHVHQFVDKFEDQLASWSKRDGDQDVLYFAGTVRQCRKCGAYRFRPNDPELGEVEVTL